MPPRPKENVWNYPRPPALQPTSSRLRIIWVTPSKKELVIADTTQGYRVLETSHPPTYYLPPNSVRMDLIKPSKSRRTLCEWKGMAAYHDLEFSNEQGPIVIGRIWSYPDPTPSFTKIKDHLCFYATSKTDPDHLGKWKCMVDDDEVVAQEGDFYGSWITPEITGGDKGFKGDAAGPSSSSRKRDPLAPYKGFTFSETLEDLSSRFIVNLPANELASIERICFQVEQGHWFYEDFLRPLNSTLPSLGLRRFSSFLLHTASMTVPLIQRYITGGDGQQDLEAAFDEFLKYKTRVPVCGAVLLAENWDKCLLVKGWKSSASWGFPKGKINQDEPERDCAIREVLEETGYECSALLAPDSQDYLDLTMREQKIRLYIVPGVSEQTRFEAQTRKEISKIAWFKLSDLPTWKKSKDPPAGLGGKFYLISPFIGRLKQWIYANRYTHPHRPKSKTDVEADISQMVSLKVGMEADTSQVVSSGSKLSVGGYTSPSPRPEPAKASNLLPIFPDSSSFFPLFTSDGNHPAALPKSTPLPAPPLSEMLKALLGLPSATQQPEPSTMPVAKLDSDPFSIAGPQRNEPSSDARGNDLLGLLRESHMAPPPVSQFNGETSSPEKEKRAATLLAALNQGLASLHGNNIPSSSTPVSHHHQHHEVAQQSSPGPQALLDLLNSRAKSPFVSQVQAPVPSQSPLPAPRPQKSIQAQKLLQMISPVSSSFVGQDDLSQSSIVSHEEPQPPQFYHAQQQSQFQPQPQLQYQQAYSSAPIPMLLPVMIQPPYPASTAQLLNHGYLPPPPPPPHQGSVPSHHPQPMQWPFVAGGVNPSTIPPASDYDPNNVMHFTKDGRNMQAYKLPQSGQALFLLRDCRSYGDEHFDFEHEHVNKPVQAENQYHLAKADDSTGPPI